jgi:hypothetical protein
VGFEGDWCDWQWVVFLVFEARRLAGADNVSITRGHANLLAEQYKKYYPLPVTPITFEAHGRFGLTALDFLHQMSKTLPTLREQTTAYHHTIQHLSTTFQRNNAQTINTHLATATTLKHKVR